jgi:sugar lactone lactonase YvrE
MKVAGVRRRCFSLIHRASVLFLAPTEVLSRSRRQFAWLTLALLLSPALSWASFSLTFQGLVRTLNTGGSITLTSPSGIVVDAAGNTFVVDTVSNNIVEVNAQGTASVLTISGLGTALSLPTAIAIDGSGNLYIADTGNSRVVKVDTTGAGSVVSTGSVTLSSPRGVALDQSGNLFIADANNNRIVEVTPGGAAAVITITVSSGSSTLSNPKGLAVNVSGKLYIADSGNNRIVTVASGSTTGVVQSILGGVTLSGPSAVAVDRIGNIIIADNFNSRIAEVDTSSNGTVLYTGSQNLFQPAAIALDVFGNVYISDTGHSRVLVVNPPVNGDLTSSDPTYSLNQSAVGFGHVQLGSSSPVTLTLEFTTGASGLGGVKVLTFGTPNLDFTSGPDTTCNSSTGSSTLCFVEVNFLPTAPGLRKGAVVLLDTSLNPLLTIPLYGFSDAPLAALAPNVGSVLSTGGLITSNPYEIALDGTGNFYVGNYTGKNVIKVPAGGGSAAVVNLGTPGGTALQNITGVAVDGAGNLFIGDHQNSRILVMTPEGVVSVLTINGLSPSLGFPTALNFDAAGNLYIEDFTNARIVEISTLVVAGSASSGKGTVIGTSPFSFTGSTMTGMTIDQQGNIYIAARTQNSSSIIKVTAAGVASALTIPSNITPAISNPQGVAVDAMGNRYIVDTANSRIVEITSAGVGSVLRISGLTSPATLSSLVFGVTADSSGNIYIPDWTNNRLVFVNVSGAALSAFATTNAGSTSTDSPKTATVTNLGNQPLIFSADPGYTPDFSQPTGSISQCLNATSLTSGTACNVSVQFTPQSSGSLSAGITVTDNTLNVASSTQQISVSGTATNPADTTAVAVSTNPTSGSIGQSLTVTAVVTDTTSGHTSTVPTGTVTFMDTVGSTTVSLNGGNPVTLSSGSAVLTGVTLSGAGSHTITANYAGVSGTFQASTNTTTITVSKDTETIAGPSTQPVQLTVGQSGSIPITVTGPFSTVPRPTGSLTYSILNSGNTSVASGSAVLTAGSTNSTATIPVPNTLDAGSYTVSVSYAGDSNYAASSTPTTIQLSVGQITPTITWTPPATIITVGTTLSAILNATASDESTTIPGTFSYTATVLGGAPVAVTSATVLAPGQYTLTATFTPTDTTTYSSATGTTPLTVQDFVWNIASGGSTTATVLPGGTATYALTFAPSTGLTFPSAVTLTVSGNPPGSTATLTPDTIPAGSGSTSVTLTILVPKQTASVRHRNLSGAFQASTLMLGMLLLPFGGPIRRAANRHERKLRLLLLAIIAVSAMTLSACGTRSGFFGSPKTDYTIAVTATSGSISHTATLNLTVR